MKAFLLAAGEGTRMRPLTSSRPKPLLPVGGRPFLSHVFARLREAGVEEVTVLTGWAGRALKEHFGTGESVGLALKYVEQDRREGTAAAVALAEGHVDDPFLCVNGDVLFDAPDLEGMLARAAEADRTLVGAARADRPERFGALQVDGDHLAGVVEKPPRAAGPWVNAGLYVFRHDIFEWIRKTPRSPRGEYEITDTLRLLLQEKEVGVHRLEGPWLDVGYPWDLLEANELLLRDLEPDVQGTVEEGATLHGPVRVAEDARVLAGAYVEGPVILDEGSVVGPNCYVRPSTYVGPDCRVGNACEVKNSILMRGTHVPHHNYVGDSVLGADCNLGSGTKVANLRLDEGSIHVTVKGRRVDTGRRKLGVIMGDGVKTGVNVSIDVGTLIGENSAIGPGASVRGSVAPGSRVY